MKFNFYPSSTVEESILASTRIGLYEKQSRAVNSFLYMYLNIKKNFYIILYFYILVIIRSRKSIIFSVLKFHEII